MVQTGSGQQFFRESFADVLFGEGQLLDANKYYIILPDGIGHGQSSKPSDGLRAQFPKYGYLDMVRAQHILLTEHLKVNHLYLVMGTSMGECSHGCGDMNTPILWIFCFRWRACLWKLPDAIG